MVRKILLVEDDEPILDVMDLLIRKLGYEPVLLSNGLDALGYARREPPALILLDIVMMPGVISMYSVCVASHFLSPAVLACVNAGDAHITV